MQLNIWMELSHLNKKNGIKFIKELREVTLIFSDLYLLADIILAGNIITDN